MTPKEKAEELLLDMANVCLFDEYISKECALIAVDEILEVIYYEGRSEYIYWQEVKNEIDNITN